LTSPVHGHPITSYVTTESTPPREPFDEVRVGDAASIIGDDALDLSDLLNTVLDRGAVVHGEVTIAVADVDLIKLNIGLLLQAVASAELRRGPGSAPSEGRSLAGAMGAVPHKNAFSPSAPLLAAAVTREGDKQYSKAALNERSEQALNQVAQGLPERINADAAGPESGLARLVLTLIEVLRKVLEHQAVRRMEGGRLTNEEVERLGLALARLNDRMGELKRVFGLTEEDLQIDLGPLGRLR
jgi:hypothetical protein